MSEVQDVAQIIKVTYEGVDICLKVVDANWRFVQEFFGIFKKLLDQEKLSGKTSVNKLLKTGGDLQVFKFKTEDLQMVKKLADKHKILYAILPDINLHDGMSEILFHSQAAPRIQAIMEMVKESRIETMDDYFANGEPEAVEKLVQDAGKKPGFGKRDYELVAKEFYQKPGTSVSEVRMKLNLKWLDIWPIVKHMQKHGLLELAENKAVQMKISEQEFNALADTNQWQEWFPDNQSEQTVEEALRDQKNLEDIRKIQKSTVADDKVNPVTIDRKMVTRETEHHIMTRIPYRKNEHIWLRKTDIIWINSDKTIYTTLEKEKTYTVLDAENNYVRKISGQELFKQSYDAVKRERDKQEKERQRKKKQKYQKSQQALESAKRKVDGKPKRR